jgi:integrase
MARQVQRLSARSVAAERKPGMHADGLGLYLYVSKSGAKSWIYRFMLRGRSRDMGLGGLDVVSLSEARERALEARKLVKAGIDPIEERNAERAREAVDAASRMTFADCARALIKSHEAGWRNPKHRQQWRNTLATYAYPVFGNLPVDTVDTGLVMKVIEPLWTTKTETASRLRGRIEAVLDWAAARGYRSGENPARWRGHLDKLLPRREKVQRVQHHPAMSYEDVAAFMQALRDREGFAARGLEFLILTAARPGEVYGAAWDEIDLDKAVWTIPDGRMKAGMEHRVPLTDRAIVLLQEMQRLRISNFVFPGQGPGRPLSNMAFLQLLKRMGHGDLTAHGFRSTFRDWAAERTSFPRELAEKALAHAVGNKVEAAYQRGDLFDKRRKLMDAWAQYCDSATHPTSNVTSIHRTAV